MPRVVVAHCCQVLIINESLVLRPKAREHQATRRHRNQPIERKKGTPDSRDELAPPPSRVTWLINVITLALLSIEGVNGWTCDDRHDGKVPCSPPRERLVTPHWPSVFTPHAHTWPSFARAKVGPHSLSEVFKLSTEGGTTLAAQINVKLGTVPSVDVCAQLCLLADSAKEKFKEEITKIDFVTTKWAKL